MIEQKDHAFAAASADGDVRVIILAAAGILSGPDTICIPEEKADPRRRPFANGVGGEYALSRHPFLDTTLRWPDLENRPPPGCRAVYLFERHAPYRTIPEYLPRSAEKSGLPYFQASWAANGESLVERAETRFCIIEGSLRRRTCSLAPRGFARRLS
jgi:hypothetical protein